jgi:predicted nucleic-acid-binding protein
LSNISCDQPNFKISLQGLAADGAIAYEGRWLGAETFVSFDKKAVKLIETNGGLARLLG